MNGSTYSEGVSQEISFEKYIISLF
jgi:hypothetical protein